MKAAELITRVSQLGGRLYLDGGELRLKAPKGSLDEELREQLKEQKAAIIDFLHAAQASDLSAEPEIATVNRDAEIPASFSQQRLWFLEELEPGNSIYNMPFTMRLRGMLDLSALQVAVDDLVQRHESLHTHFAYQGERPVQVIDNSIRISVGHEKAHGLDDAKIAKWLAVNSAQAFDLYKGPLLRVDVLEVAEDDFRLLLVMHHIVSDAWSMSVLIQELTRLYAQHCGGEPANLPELQLQYADYAAWQRDWLAGPGLERQVAYWRERLADAPPLLELPTDRPRPASQSYRGDHLTVTTSARLTEQLRSLAQSEGMSMFMLLQTIFNVLLARYTGNDDVVIGTPVAGRGRTEIEPLIGLFLNTLVLRNDLSGNPEFASLLDQVRKTTLAAYDHQDLPFEKLVDELQPERQLSYSPIFQVMFNLRAQSGDAMSMHGLEVEFDDIERPTAMFDLALSVDEGADSMSMEFEFSTDLFDRDSIERMADVYLTLLEGIVANPRCRIHDLPILSDEDRQTLLVDWNATDFAYPDGLTVHALFEQSAAAAPDNIALWTEREELTYAELNRRANRLAGKLIETGAGPGTLIGISIERTAEMIIGMLATLKSGAAYVPLDPNYPADRVSFMLEDCQAPIVLSKTSVAADLPKTQAQVICLDTFDWGDATAETLNPTAGASPSDLA
ncbi:MAG: condensation domain-containing protein, partial [Gammaproteobacteria bacterium]